MVKLTADDDPCRAEIVRYLLVRHEHRSAVAAQRILYGELTADAAAHAVEDAVVDVVEDGLSGFCAGLEDEFCKQRLIIRHRRHIRTLEVGKLRALERLERWDYIRVACVIDRHDTERIALIQVKQRDLTAAARCEVYPQLAAENENYPVLFDCFEDDIFPAPIAAVNGVILKPLSVLFAELAPKRNALGNSVLHIITPPKFFSHEPQFIRLKNICADAFHLFV